MTDEALRAAALALLPGGMRDPVTVRMMMTRLRDAQSGRSPAGQIVGDHMDNAAAGLPPSQEDGERWISLGLMEPPLGDDGNDG